MSEEKKCRHCAMMIPKEAKVCPHCRKTQGTSTFVWVLAIFFGLIFIGMCSSFLSDSNKGSNQSTSTPAANTEPVLELQNWSWHKEYGYAIAEGMVKNISSKPLDDVVAILNIYDKQNNFIKSDHALIDYRPILPGQSSPFKVMASYNPAMDTAFIDFKTFSGGTLSWIKKKGNKK